MSEMDTPSGAYVCGYCSERWIVADYPAGGALDAARAHAEECAGPAEPRYDPDLDADQYDVDFSEVDNESES